MRLQFSPSDIPRILRQRLFWFAIPFAIVATLGLVAISKLPPLYESEAQMLVIGQQVPTEYVASGVQDEAMGRLLRVRTQVLARDNLIRTGERLGVFAGGSMTRTDKHAHMIERTTIAVTQGDGRRRGSRNEAALVQTRIAFRDTDPNVAQRVANDLTTQFDSMIIELGREQAGEATEFLQEEETKTRRAIQRLGDQIARIKNENPNALPDNRSLYEGSLQRVLLDRDRLEATLEQARTELATLRLQQPVYTANTSADEAQLAEARRVLVALRGQYTETYPDVIAARERVMELERTADPTAFRRNAQDEIRSLESQISDAAEGSAARTRLTARRDELRAQIRDARNTAAPVGPGQAQFSAAMLTVTERIASIERQIEDRTRQIADLENRIGQLPEVENQLYVLLQEQQRLETDLRRLQQNRAEAERSQSLVAQAKAERVAIVQQPVRPEAPTSPDKPKLAIMIFALAAGLAGALAVLPEILFARVQSKAHLNEAMPGVPVIEVPRFKSADERTPKLVATASLTAATLVLGVALTWTAFQTLT